MSEDAFGFNSAAKTAKKIEAIRPTEPAPMPSMTKVDAIADSHGFPSREAARPAAPAYRRRREQGPFINIQIRAPERIGSRFIRFCEDNRFNYWEGLEDLLKRTGIDTD